MVVGLPPANSATNFPVATAILTQHGVTTSNHQVIGTLGKSDIRQSVGRQRAETIPYFFAQMSFKLLLIG